MVQNIMEDGDAGGAYATQITADQEIFTTAGAVYLGRKGVMRITPLQQVQTYTLHTIAYIANGVPEPKMQVVPVTDVNVNPHQISFNFFDTSEGKIGVSNPLEKHMQVELDIYVSDLIFMLWNNGYDGVDDYRANDQYMALMNAYDQISNENYLNFTDNLVLLEDTTEFIEFRQNFLQQHSGWMCTFTSDVFGTFDGVLTEVKYELGGGEVDSKFHIKIEEAIFTDNYSPTGATDQQEEQQKQASNGSEASSGDAST